MEMRIIGDHVKDNTIIGKLIWRDSKNAKVQSEFFSIVREQTKIKWLIDDHIFFEQNLNAKMNENYIKPFQIIQNVAVGAQFPGNPDASTFFPKDMVVDYIRVFEINYISTMQSRNSCVKCKKNSL